jgi:hypothetical protein
MRFELCKLDQIALISHNRLRKSSEGFSLGMLSEVDCVAQNLICKGYRPVAFALEAISPMTCHCEP